MAVAGPAPPVSTDISVRLKGDATTVQFSKGDPADDVKDAIRLALELDDGMRYRLRTASGAVRAANGNLPRGEYTVEVIHSDP